MGSFSRGTTRSRITIFFELGRDGTVFLQVTLWTNGQWEGPYLPALREECGVQMQELGAAPTAAEESWQRGQSIEQILHRLGDCNEARPVRHDTCLPAYLDYIAF